MNLAEMFEKYRQLNAEKAELDKRSNSLKREIKELEVVAENIEKAVGEDIAGKEANQKNTEKGKEREI